MRPFGKSYASDPRVAASGQQIARCLGRQSLVTRRPPGHPTPLISRPCLRRLLRAKSIIARAHVQTSGLYEWSQNEIVRLQPTWLYAFLARHRRWKMVLRTVMVLLLAAAIFRTGQSIDGFRTFIATTGTDHTAPDPIRVIDQWKGYCIVYKHIKACRPKPAPPAPKRDKPSVTSAPDRGRGGHAVAG